MVLHIEGGFPPDIRVYKEARALIKRGFEVHVLCKMKKGQSAKELTDYGLHIHREKINEKSNISKLFPKKLNTLKQHFSFQRPKHHWKTAIRKFVKTVGPDAIHCHDLPALPVCWEVASETNIPLVADLHENWPGFTITGVEQLSWWKRVLKRRHYLKWKQLEETYLKRCQKIVVVVPEATQRIVENYCIAPNKITVVSNTENDATILTGDVDLPQEFEDRWIASYVGGIGPHRGIDTSIRAAGIVGPKINEFLLAIIGPSEKQIPELKRMIKEANAEAFVSITPRIPSDHVAEYILASDVCLVPHNDTEHTNTTVPHKLFQYMILERPVLVSDCPPLKRIVEAADCGQVFRRNDPLDMANKFIDLYKNKNQTKVQAANGRQSALGKYCWEHDAKRLSQVYESIILDKINSEI